MAIFYLGVTKNIRLWAMKFCIVAALFQILIIILYGVLVEYGDHALPPHKRKEANQNASASNPSLEVNDVSVYYPSK